MKIGGAPPPPKVSPRPGLLVQSPSGAGCVGAPGSAAALGLGSSSEAAGKNTALMMLSMEMAVSIPKEQLQPPAWPCPARFPSPHAARPFVVVSSLFFSF